MESENKIFHDIREIIRGEVCGVCPSKGEEVCYRVHQKRCYSLYDVQASKIAIYILNLVQGNY